MKRWLSFAALALSACGQGTGTGSGTGDLTCYFEDECGCFEHSNCQMKTEGCWCASMCGLDVECFCSGGKFLGCEPQVENTAPPPTTTGVTHPTNQPSP